jgi:hypothetical protein
MPLSKLSRDSAVMAEGGMVYLATCFDWLAQMATYSPPRWQERWWGKKHSPERYKERTRKLFITWAEAAEELRSSGIPLDVLNYLPRYKGDELPPEQRIRPKGLCKTRNVIDAIFEAAIEHGRDGRGQDGLQGYMRRLAETHSNAFPKV